MQEGGDVVGNGSNERRTGSDQKVQCLLIVLCDILRLSFRFL